MKFGQQLELNTFPQWSQYYVRYRQIKNHINALFPTPAELSKEAQEDRHRALAALEKLTDPAKAAAHKAAQEQKAAAASSSGTRRDPSPQSPDSDEQESEALLKSTASAADVAHANAVTVAAGSGVALHSFLPPSDSSSINGISGEKVPFNIHTKRYGVPDEDVSSDEDDEALARMAKHAPAADSKATSSNGNGRVTVQLNDRPISTNASAAHSPADSRDSSPSRVTAAAAAASSSRPPHVSRRVSGLGADSSLRVSSKRFHPLAPVSHVEKMDQIMVKLMSELQKIDEFHRIMEAKILAAFAGLKAQVAAAKEGDMASEGINRKMREMKASHRFPSSGSGNKLNSMRASSSAGSLLKVEEAAAADEDKDKEPSSSGRSSPSPSSAPSPSPSPGLRRNNSHDDSDSGSSTHAHHSLGHVRYHSGAVNSTREQGHHNKHGHHGHHHSSSSTSGGRSRSGSMDGSSSIVSGIDSIPLRAAFSQLLRRATMLIHFVDINFVAFAKLLKCFEKRSMAALKASRELIADPSLLAQAKRTHKQLQLTVQNHSFYTSRRIDTEVVPEIYRLYGETFEGGNVEKAKLILLAALTEQEYSRTDSFWLGAKLGVIFMLLALLIIIMARPAADLDLVSNMQLFAPIYRCVGLLVLLVWLWGFLVQIWDNFGIPYVLIFGLNPRTRLTNFQIHTEAANLTIVYLLNSTLFITHSGTMLWEGFSLSIYPFALFLFFLVKLFWPGRRWMAHWHTRQTLLSTLGNIVIAPFGKTRFIETFVADVMTSMIKVFVDVEASTCLVATYYILDRIAVIPKCTEYSQYIVPIICALPLWFRFNQCMRRYYETQLRWPHIANAAKYFITHSVVIMAAYHPVFNNAHNQNWETYRIIWLCCCVVSTLYATWWDTVMDWGLFQRGPGVEWPGLRADLLYGHVAFYYCASHKQAASAHLRMLSCCMFFFSVEVADRYFPLFLPSSVFVRCVLL